MTIAIISVINLALAGATVFSLWRAWRICQTHGRKPPALVLPLSACILFVGLQAMDLAGMMTPERLKTGWHGFDLLALAAMWSTVNRLGKQRVNLE